MKSIFFAAVIMFCSTYLYSYSYICNGILADGSKRGDDGCGLCDEARAARWVNPNVKVNTDLNKLPSNITKEDFITTLQESLNEWTKVSTSKFSFVLDLTTTAKRNIGTDETSHEIFFITDVKEWREKVGLGELETLGATLPRYACGGLLGESRVIYDGDLIINALPGNDWVLECDDPGCISLKTTLVHEAGHMLGLDHPCIDCEGSIMAAKAAFDSKKPKADDILGLSSLYPFDSKNYLGKSCETDISCPGDYVCILDNGVKYCANKCTGNKDCDDFTECKNIASQNVCQFIDIASYILKDEGEICTKSSCKEPLMCAGAKDLGYKCFMPCDAQQDCKIDQSCTPVGDFSVCLSFAGKGEYCDGLTFCDSSLTCIREIGGQNDGGLCYKECSLSKEDCPQGEVCEQIEYDIAACVKSTTGKVISDSKDDSQTAVAIDIDDNDKKSSGCTQTRQSFLLVNLLLMILLKIGKKKPLNKH